MIAVIQRVRQASVAAEGQCIARICQGLLVLLGVAQDDNDSDAAYMIEKIPRLRMFSDARGQMNKSLQDINGELLLVSQFTLLAKTNKGRRPSFEKAAPPEEARLHYQNIIEKLQAQGITVQSGLFGKTMLVSLENEGPVTLILDSRGKELVKKIKTPV